ncbi:N-terminal nucleophile aminohydrolase [Tuber magnatum]|uniref:N-terminal nucleophile aminohydrolase n=1 Tax=Tuber magnatum TaxID=42249 RepID=A0A317T244_9PEZI|nr:N-terminal nucleophile aminohydrolase [Tuber magnatum]
MCRFLVYKGTNPILLSDLILNPTHSILTQSYDCRLRLDSLPHNGDGFGVGYYTTPTLSTEPCIFTSTTPAWNCVNLSRLAKKTASSLVFAHVRATTSGALSESNCHPFSYGSLMFMHNGHIANFKKIKRAIVSAIRDEYFLMVEGSTDSEWAFAVFLDTLHSLGHSPKSPPEVQNERAGGGGGFGHGVLRQAMLGTIRRLNEFLDEAGTGEPSLLNFAATDGHSVVCTRYVCSRTDEAASLYFSSGTRFHEYKEGGFYRMERHDRGQDLVMVASEPLTFERGDWVTVPTNSILTINKQTVLIHPIIDKYYQQNPAYSRSAAFAESKGMVAEPVVSSKSVKSGTKKPAARNGKDVHPTDADRLPSGSDEGE